ncbi:MAG: hypothetical protein KDB00_08085 [Planctomycetales bacterium]|nr:hypothetical protein [Planctomycetales bacterium]
MKLVKVQRARMFGGAVWAVLFCSIGFADLPESFDRNDPLYKSGLLDITKAPYSADPTGVQDSTQAIQRAVNDARDNSLVCFFPQGTFLISDTISCEQQVEKLDRPRATDGRTQHYWDRSHRIVLFGSGKGRRPVIKLSDKAQGFNDPDRPKYVIKIWAQTRDDAPGKQEPEWGKEQPNIAFNHYLKGIDIDIRGHAGAIGLRFSGSQGSSLLDCTVYAQGAFAGFSDCPGQGGGTYNIQTIGGRFGITLDSASRFPLLTGCRFIDQTVACVGYHTSTQVPTLLVGCQLKPASNVAVDLTGHSPMAGINLVDCRIETSESGLVVNTRKAENFHMENCYVNGVDAVATYGSKLSSTGWTRIKLFSSTNPQGIHLINGTTSTKTIEQFQNIDAPPTVDDLRNRHYRPVPAVDADAVINVTDYGAKGDGMTDDTQAFRKAIAAGEQIFVPRGTFLISGELQLQPNTHLFGLTSTHSTLGRRFSRGQRRDPQEASFTITTVDSADAAPGFSHLAVNGSLQWRSGQGTMMLAGRFPQSLSGHGGGRFYGVRSIGQQSVVKDIHSPVSLYAFNVERVGTNPQSLFENCRHLRIFYFKVEAGTLNRGGDPNTPSRIESCRDVRIHCMYGNVRKLGERPMLDVVDCQDIAVSQLKAFQPSTFPHLIETRNLERIVAPSTKTIALFARDNEETDVVE